MKTIYTHCDRVTIMQTDGLIDPLRVLQPVALTNRVVSTRKRDLVLTSRDYEGRDVLAAYDRPTDTLYICVGSP